MPTSLLNLSGYIHTPDAAPRTLARSGRALLLFNDFDAMGTTPNWKDTYTLVQYGDLLIEDCYLPRLAHSTPTGGYTFETPPTERAWREELGREVNVLRVDKLVGAGSGPSMPPKPGYQQGVLTKNGVCLQDRGLDLLELGLADGMLTIGGRRVEKLRLPAPGRYDTPEVWEAIEALLTRPHTLAVKQIEAFLATRGDGEGMKRLEAWYIDDHPDGMFCEPKRQWRCHEWDQLR